MLFSWRPVPPREPFVASFRDLRERQVNERCWPSKAFIDLGTGELLVGPAAITRLNSSPNSGVMLPSAKRYFRFEASDLTPTKLPPRLRERPWPTPDQMGDCWRSPQDVVDALISVGLQAAAAEYDVADWDCMSGCLGVPAEWDEPARQRLAHLAGSVGLDTGSLSRIVEEPILAARAYLAMSADAEPGNYVVYDLGGGSFDAAWVEYDGPDRPLRVAACVGDLELGGDDVDVAIATLLEEKIAEFTGEDGDELRWYVRQPGGDSYLAALWDSRSEQAKQRIGDASEVHLSRLELELARLPLRRDPPGADITITRGEMLTLLRPLVADTKTCLDRLARQRLAHLEQPAIKARIEDSAGEIRGIVLVGGMTRMPIVRQLLAEMLPGMPLLTARTVPPEELVIWGTCLGDQLCSVNTHRLCYEIAIEFRDALGHSCGRASALERYETGYDWHATLGGSIPPRRATVPVPTSARTARLVYVRQDGEAVVERAYLEATIGAMPTLDAIEVKSPTMLVVVKPSGLISLYPGNHAELWPRSMPWLDGAAKAQLELDIRAAHAKWGRRMVALEKIDSELE